ncbi:Sugar phosphate isomerase/epimerase [Maridesulfovibrio ferrireducens]|uniref:Sugar phosphate isomerase/epimerase n=1 Tax=Maridesulfovibrio ferrireducens TaxID=246191 RepID=A0A1G9ES38_9BACT|nr:sugar phosphate isomerase/epimerase family protein [Maridesulfovibrio ferrireducens]SDK78959.1 Sugar phosphate isomerase/epimerase [Maridesulfovibrio ferrireducens]
MSKAIDRLFLSSSCFNDKTVFQMMDIVSSFGMAGLELGSFSGRVPPCDEILQASREKGVRLLVHNYFPPAFSPFVMNLGAEDKAVREKSLLLAEKAILFCELAGIPFYSVHAGFSCHAEPEDLGCPLTSLPRFSKDQAVDNFILSIRRLCSFAVARGVSIAVENHVVAQFNLVDGYNVLLPGATPEELLYILNESRAENIGLLVDFGHLKVTSNTLGFDACVALKKLLPYTFGVHIHDNDGCSDIHLPIHEKAWFMDLLRDSSYSNFLLVLEMPGLSLDSLDKQIALFNKDGR